MLKPSTNTPEAQKLNELIEWSAERDVTDGWDNEGQKKGVRRELWRRDTSAGQQLFLRLVHLCAMLCSAVPRRPGLAGFSLHIDRLL